jgi:hypothetical protein
LLVRISVFSRVFGSLHSQPVIPAISLLTPQHRLLPR